MDTSLNSSSRNLLKGAFLGCFLAILLFLGDTGSGAEKSFTTEIKKLLSSDLGAGDEFGLNVEVHNDWAFIGATHSDHPFNDSGAVYLFERNFGGPDNWGETRIITQSDGLVGDHFGISMSVDGDTLIAGADFDDDNGIDSGSVYLFQQNAGGANNWGEVKKLSPAGLGAGDRFGHSVAILGDIAAVGAREDSSGAGTVYLFGRNQGGTDNWGLIKTVTAGDGASGDQFGMRVFLDGSRLYVGAPFNLTKGAVYIFGKNQGGENNWGLVKKVVASDGGFSDMFGRYLSAFGDTLVAGASEDDDSGVNAGAVYIYEKDLGGVDNWGERKKFSAGDTAAGDLFGFQVSLYQDLLLVGAENNETTGSAYLFSRDEGGVNNWGQVDKLKASDPFANDKFGRSVVMENTTIIVGAWQNDDACAIDPACNSGSAYVFYLAPVATPTATDTETPTALPSATITPSETPTPAATATFTASPTASFTPSNTPPATATSTASPGPTQTPTNTVVPTNTATPAATGSQSPTPTSSQVPSPEPTLTMTATSSATPSQTAFPPSATPSSTPKPRLFFIPIVFREN